MSLIRLARESDARDMGEVFYQAAVAAWSHIMPADALKAEPRKPEMFARAVRAAETVVRVADSAESGGKGVVTSGFVITRLSADRDAGFEVGELHMCYVHPEAWGSGVADALMASALEDLRAAGYRRATLWTAEANHRPRAFYERHGWTLDGTRRSKTRLDSTFTELRYAIPL
jgi:GNAT superfamily N-acetyltransferase